MRWMGFAEQWINLIMICISTVTNAFKLNGEPMGYIRPKRGIRKGDPLSPYLFVLCAEGLSMLFEKWEEQGRIRGVSICQGAPSVHHLLFADDSFIFAHSTLRECLHIKELLGTYERASGQAVNFAKSCVAFSANLTDCDQQLLADCLCMKRVGFHDRSLDLLVFVGRSKMQTFAYVKDRVWKKLQGWRGSLLSSAGKEILVKTVAQAVPIYTMQCFLLPKTLCEELNAIIANFWWGGDQHRRRIHW